MRIVLHGGYSGNWDNAGQDAELFRLLINAAEQANNRLLVCFLSKENPQDFFFLGDFIKNLRAINPALHIDVAGCDNIRELLLQHQVVFIQGGSTEEHFAAWQDITADELTHDKVFLAGSSSGAMLLAQWGYGRKNNQPIKGKGIIDLAVLPHADTWAVQDYLSQIHNVTSSPVMMLKENALVEFSI